MEKANLPKVTVLMPVYNGGCYLRESIQSILNQTYTDFEFLIINDGSTDNTVEIVKSYNDSRIRLEQNDKNLGLIDTLNKGLKLAKGEYIVRMDDDDISLPQRIEKQVAFMDSNPAIGVCGTWSRTFGEGINSWETKYPVEHEDIKAHYLFNIAISHPTAILRKAMFEKNNLEFQKEAKHFEDYQLFSMALDFVKFANIPEILFEYRVSHNQISSIYAKEQSVGSKEVRKQILNKIGIEPSDEELSIHISLSVGDYKRDRSYYINVSKWLDKINKANSKTHYYKPKALKRIIYKHWENICILNRGMGFEAIYWYFRNSMFRFSLNKAVLNFLIKACIYGFKSILNFTK